MKSLGQHLQDTFGGEIDSDWGTPFDRNMRASLIKLPKQPTDKEVEHAITKFYKENGFRKMDIDSSLTFQNADNDHRYAAYSNHKYFRGAEIRKIIVSGAKF